MSYRLVDIRNRIRTLTGRSDLSDAELNDYVNFFYQYRLPDFLDPLEFRAIYYINLISDLGEYPLEDEMRALFPPVLIDDEPVELVRDVEFFFSTFTDRASARGKPTHVLQFQRALWVYPIPDTDYLLKVNVLYRPDKLEDDLDLPISQSWIDLLAFGASALLYTDMGDYESASTMMQLASNSASLVRRDYILNRSDVRIIGAL